MNSLIIPSTPNWYSSTILACAPDNTLIYGSRNDIVIISPASFDKTADIKIIPNAHSDRIHSLAINPNWNDPDKFVVTMGVDKIVRLWDLKTCLIKHAHNAHTTSLEEVAGVSFGGSNRVISVSGDGFIVIWQLSNNELLPMKNLFSSATKITCMSSCPHQHSLCAFGLKNGSVMIADLRKSGKIIHKLRSHEKPIVSLAWCLTPYNILHANSDRKTNDKENINDTLKIPGNLNDASNAETGSKEEPEKIPEYSKEYLLASSSKGGPVCIWRALTDGRKETEISLHAKYRKGNKALSKDWITLCWIRPDILLSTSSAGEVLKWNLSKSKKGPIVLHHDNTTLFAIAAPLHYYSLDDKENWDKKILSCWTFGQNGLLINIDLSAEQKILISYPTLNGYLYSFATSPLDPSRIAFGFYDGTVKLWNTSHPHLQYISMIHVWRKMQSGVSSLAWHPNQEVCLAYGTMEGRVGLIETTNISKQPTMLTHNFKSTVHKLEWAPIDEDTIGLYACAEGQLVVYNINKILESPVKIKVAGKDYITQFAWKPDFKLLAIGTKIGTVYLYSNNKLLTTFYMQTKSVQSMSWHPQATAKDTEAYSPYADWLAVAANDVSVVVYNCAALEKDNENLGNRVVNVLTGHSKSVRSVTWSPHVNCTLASAGEDGVTQVWEVQENKLIATFTGHNFSPIMNVIWSPLNPDIIITGGRDNTLQVWKISENPPQINIDVVTKKASATKMITLEIADSSENIIEEKTKIKKGIRAIMLNCISKLLSENSPTLIDDCKKLLEYCESKKIADPDTDNSEEPLSEENDLTVDDSKLEILQLFGDHKNIHKLLDLEQTNHKEKGKPVCYQHVSLWKGDFGNAIKDAIANGNVSPWLISIAPMVSRTLWQEAVESYANQLLDSPKFDPMEAASYFLTCHQVEKAIQVLCTSSYHREALAIAKCHLPESSPLINEILQKWATFCVINGSYELATLCFIALDKFEEATKALFRRTDPEALQFAAQLAKKCNNEDLYNAVVFRLDAFKTKEVEIEECKLPTRSDLEIAEIENNKSDIEHINLTVDSGVELQELHENYTVSDSVNDDIDEKLSNKEENLESEQDNSVVCDKDNDGKLTKEDILGDGQKKPEIQE